MDHDEEPDEETKAEIELGIVLYPKGYVPKHVRWSKQLAQPTTDLDIPTDTGANKEVAGIPYLDSDGSIYWYIKSQSGNVGVTKKRTSAGSWSTVDSTNALRGPIQALKVVT